MPIWGTALWKFEGYIKVGHIDAHLNSLPILEGDWNRQADMPICSLKVATWVYKIGRHWGSTAVQRWAESRHIPLAPSAALNANKNCSVCQQKRQRRQMAMWHISLWEGPEYSWQVRLRLVALGGYKWVLTGIDTDSGLEFAYPV